MAQNCSGWERTERFCELSIFADLDILKFVQRTIRKLEETVFYRDNQYCWLSNSRGKELGMKKKTFKRTGQQARKNIHRTKFILETREEYLTEQYKTALVILNVLANGYMIFR